MTKKNKKKDKNIAYFTSKTVIDNRHPLYSYLFDFCKLSKNLYNASLFRLRQNFTANNKEHLSDNEKEVLQEIYKVVDTYSYSKPKTLISYKFLDKQMRVTNNPDFFSGLPMQSSQLVLKDAIRDFKGWLSALNEFKAQPSKFLGKPKMPNYKHSEISMVKFTNQDCIIKNGILKFPKTKLTLSLPNVDGTLQEVQVKPYYGSFIILVIYGKKVDKVVVNRPYACGIDIGVNNLVALVDNRNSCLLYKGEIIKSCNQYFNKEKARLVSALTKCQKVTYCNTKRLLQLSEKRDSFIKDYMHKVSKDIINHCLDNDIGTIVIGKNNEWKQNSNIGKVNNQNFVSIPFNILIAMIQYKAEREGITVIIREESYTSKASALDDDAIPDYKKIENPTFSGNRIKRGLYKSKDGTIINADLNGACNILRKEFPDAFNFVNKKDILNNIIVKNIKNINIR